jgi:uncharacterized protein (DUF2062 family)
MVEMTETPAGPDCTPKVCRSRWSTLMERIAQADTPHRTAAAFACGVFLSFSPLLGLQIVIAIGLAVLLRMSRVALLAGLCTNLPWIMVPWYTVTTVLAAAALGTPVGPEVRVALTNLLDMSFFSTAFWTEAIEIVTPFLWSFLIGSTIGAVLIGIGAYLTVVRLVKRLQALPSTPGELLVE